MKELMIDIDDIFKIRTFVNISSKYDFDIKLSSDNYYVSAKSIIGIFTLDITKPIKITIYTDDYEDYLYQIKDFIIPSKQNV